MLGVEVPPTVAFDYPSISALAKFIEDEYATPLKIDDRIQGDVDDLLGSDGQIFVRSIGSRLPGPGADAAGGSVAGLVGFGRDPVTTVPRDRWDIEDHFDPSGDNPVASYTRFGGFCDGVFLFDASTFGLSAQEARWLDPQIRMLLEDHASHISPQSHRGTDTVVGIFVGCMYHEYLSDVSKTGSSVPPPHAVIGNGAAYMAGRISFTYGTTGPSVCTDTACSSSLVSCHLASKSLRLHETALNAVSGVNLMLAPSTTSAICHLKALSGYGRCLTFSADADGYGRAEASVVMTLAGRAAARGAGGVIAGAFSDGDTGIDTGIEGAICELRASNINQDGRSSGLTAPNGPAQSSLLSSARARGGLAAADVVALSTHGTGTPLGDPIEVSAIQKSYERGARTTLLSSKSSVGHCEGAAGLVGLLFALDPLLSKEESAIAHLRQMNPFVSQSLHGWKTPHAVNRQPSCLIGGEGAVTACSSFGMSGIDAHALLGTREHGASVFAGALKRGTLPFTRLQCRHTVAMPHCVRRWSRLRRGASPHRASHVRFEAIRMDAGSGDTGFAMLLESCRAAAVLADEAGGASRRCRPRLAQLDGAAGRGFPGV